MPRLKWTRVKRVPAIKHKTNKPLSAMALAVFALVVTHNVAANNLTERLPSLGSKPTLVDNCVVEDQTVTTVWLPAHTATSAETLLARWPAHPLAAFSGCLARRYYASAEVLQCTEQGERKHMRCDLPLLPREVMQRHIVFTEAKVASASTRQIVLPLNAKLSVFAHEMGHWVGFADEYAMSSQLAEKYCRGRYDHPSLNVARTHAKELSAEQLQALWQQLPWRDAVPDWRLLGQPMGNGLWRLGSAETTQVGLFPSQTCATVKGVYSWKPVAKLTAMEYHDVNVWPAVYLDTARQLQGRRGLRDHDDRAEQGEKPH